MDFRIGHGFDVHAFSENRRLILCGVEIPFELGLLGHSDADVALHAICDSILGAAALGDIGKHFPDTDDSYKNISSMVLLKKTTELINEKGFIINNIDVTIVAQKPKLIGYIDKMRDNISLCCGCERDLISVKATTTEGLGFEGRMEGISATAVCSIVRL